MKTLGLIPAKEASTRVLRKNLRPLAGKTLLGWAAQSAMDSHVLDRVVVSTESNDVADEARALGLDVPFMRPDKLARDPAGVVDVALHALDVLEEQGSSYDVIAILLPTCPLRTSEDVSNAMTLFKDNKAKYLMSVTRCEHTPYTALKLTDNGMLEPVFPDYISGAARDIPPAYRPNGAIHILDVPAFRAVRSYTASPLTAYVMPRERSIDIDYSEDIEYAEYLLTKKRNVH